MNSKIDVHKLIEENKNFNIQFVLTKKNEQRAKEHKYPIDFIDLKFVDGIFKIAYENVILYTPVVFKNFDFNEIKIIDRITGEEKKAKLDDFDIAYSDKIICLYYIEV